MYYCYRMDGAQPPPPPPSAPGGPSGKPSKESAGGGGTGGPSKESKVFSDNVTGNTAMSAVTDSNFGQADGQSAYSLQPETDGKKKKKNDGGSNDSGGQKRSGGACICMITTAILGILSFSSAVGAGIALTMKI
uniref:Uncharacterized protein n=1 Tax=Panagrolaimus superbus TaxID=310955 RepID=A0A914Y880_9BILA